MVICQLWHEHSLRLQGHRTLHNPLSALLLTDNKHPVFVEYR